jgi:parvulin-like peptidyl-prolyl isomerase
MSKKDTNKKLDRELGKVGGTLSAKELEQIKEKLGISRGVQNAAKDLGIKISDSITKDKPAPKPAPKPNSTTATNSTSNLSQQHNNQQRLSQQHNKQQHLSQQHNKQQHLSLPQGLLMQRNNITKICYLEQAIKPATDLLLI